MFGNWGCLKGSNYMRRWAAFLPEGRLITGLSSPGPCNYPLFSVPFLTPCLTLCPTVFVLALLCLTGLQLSLPPTHCPLIRLSYRFCSTPLPFGPTRSLFRPLMCYTKRLLRGRSQPTSTPTAFHKTRLENPAFSWIPNLVNNLMILPFNYFDDRLCHNEFCVLC